MLMCTFMSQASNWNSFFYMRTLHKYRVSPCLHITTHIRLLYLFLTTELIFINFWINIHINRCAVPCCSYLSRKKMPLHAPKTSRPWMRIQGLVGHCPAPLHSCRVKGEFYNDRTRIYTTLYPKGRTARYARHYVIFASLHRLFSFGVQFDRVFTCTLNHIRKGINHPFQSDRNCIPIELNRIDWGVYMKALHSDWAVNPITNRLFDCM